MIETPVVVGRGLLGRSVRGAWDHDLLREIPWSQDRLLEERFQTLVGTLDEQRPEGPIPVVWTAGRAVIASSPEECRAETANLAVFLEAVAASVDPKRYVIVFASSVGGLYAGVRNGSILDETTTPRPTSPYGEEKLRQEQMLRSFCRSSGARASLVRVATAYGPGQDVRKQQGLVSALIRASLSGRPVRLYVPLETSRHFLWSGDVAQALQQLAGSLECAPGEVEIRLLSAGRPTSVIELAAVVGRIAGRRPPMLVTRNQQSSLHAIHLDIRPRRPAALRPTPLEVGVWRCWHAAARAGDALRISARSSA